MKRFLFFTGITTSIIALFSGSTAFAHVVVKPGEVTAASFQTFTVGVPNEKNDATTRVKLVIPEGLQHVSPTQKPGWEIDIEKDGKGENAKVSAITWSENTIEVGLRDEFTFSAKTPAKAGELQWKAYQTYADGTLVAWDKASSEMSGDSGPFSVTKIVEKTEAETSLQKTQQAAANASATATTSLYIAIAAVIIGLAGVFFGTRERGRR